MSKTAEEPMRQIVQAGLGTTPDRGIIQSLWIEEPANCDLRCGYCFCATRPGVRDEDPENLAWDTERPNSYPVDLYVTNILEPFAERIAAWNKATPEERVAIFDCPPENANEPDIRGKVAIPGAGEPFHPHNLGLTRDLLRHAARLDLHMTIFTSGHLIDDELAAELAPQDILLLVKCNSRVGHVQNAFVGNPDHLDYARERDGALEKLMRFGFNTPVGEPRTDRYQETRLGIVTSVMRDNLGELPDLLRLARRNNVIFDCDTILERGRGTDCPEIPSDEDTRAAFHELQMIDREEFGKYWDISRSYIGTTCDRFRHHLYVDKRGFIYPCVGCLGDERSGVPPVILGNVKDGPAALYGAWNKPLMKKILRQHVYAGPCATCLNAAEEKCYSCLGRCRNLEVRLDPEDGETPVSMKGCWNNRANH